MRNRDISLIVIGLFSGAMIGGIIGNILALLLPGGVVKDFFLTSLTMDISGIANNELGVFIIDLSIIVLKFGLSINFNFTSLIGLATAYYILRFFRWKIRDFTIDLIVKSNMFNLGSGEILLIFLGILLMFGAKKLPELARGLGKGLNEFRDAVETGKKEILETKKDIGLDQESQEKTE